MRHAQDRDHVQSFTGGPNCPLKNGGGPLQRRGIDTIPVPAPARKRQHPQPAPRQRFGPLVPMRRVDPGAHAQHALGGALDMDQAPPTSPTTTMKRVAKS